MVLALAGDSTMTRCLPAVLVRLPEPDERPVRLLVEALLLRVPALDRDLDDVLDLAIGVGCLCVDWAYRSEADRK